MDERSTVSQTQCCCRRTADSPIIKSYCHDRLFTAGRSNCNNTVQPQRIDEIFIKGKPWLKFACHVSASCSRTINFNSGDWAPGNLITTVTFVYMTKAWPIFSHALLIYFFFIVFRIGRKPENNVACVIKRKSPVLIPGSLHFYNLHIEGLHRNRRAKHRCQGHK